jgi:hypothetical protein
VEQDVIWDRSSQGRSEVLERLAIAAVEAQERPDTAEEDRTAASHTVDSLRVWPGSGGAHRVGIPNPNSIILSVARSECDEDIDTV